MSEKKYIDGLMKYLTRPTGFRTFCEDCTGIDRLDCIVEDCIKNFPAADVEEVVHCRDCKWWEKYKDSLQGRCSLHSISPTGSWYCANGVKENE